MMTKRICLQFGHYLAYTIQTDRGLDDIKLSLAGVEGSVWSTAPKGKSNAHV
jgi:hypothetical protein